MQTIAGHADRLDGLGHSPGPLELLGLPPHARMPFSLHSLLHPLPHLGSTSDSSTSDSSSSSASDMLARVDVTAFEAVYAAPAAELEQQEMLGPGYGDQCEGGARVVRGKLLRLFNPSDHFSFAAPPDACGGDGDDDEQSECRGEGKGGREGERGGRGGERVALVVTLCESEVEVRFKHC